MLDLKRGSRRREMASEARCLEKQQSNGTGAARLQRVRKLSPEIEFLCSQYLEHSLEFATRLSELVHQQQNRQARQLKGVILARCSDVITKARSAALESLGQ
jgi:hypothetical protein